ncbi:MAG TPA: glutaminase, partial [Ignavibacteriaceae bacterium]
MKHFFINTNLILIVLIALFLSGSVKLIAQDLSKTNIEKVLNEAYNKFKDVKEGANADYIKELATVDPNIYGIALVTTDGQVYTAGDITSMVSIQSVSKVFTMAKVIEEKGPQAVQDMIGVDATGEVFNSICAVERMRGKEINPLVNPGAIASTSMIEGVDSAAKWKSILQVHS